MQHAGLREHAGRALDLAYGSSEKMAETVMEQIRVEARSADHGSAAQMQRETQTCLREDLDRSAVWT